MMFNDVDRGSGRNVERLQLTVVSQRRAGRAARVGVRSSHGGSGAALVEPDGSLTRSDRVEPSVWNPDAPGQQDGPPGLPLHSIVAGLAADRHGEGIQALDAITAAARGGHFSAALTIRTVLASR